MTWKNIILKNEEFKDEKFFISENGNSFISGSFNTADLRFGLKGSTFGKIIDLAKGHKDAFKSYSIDTKNGVILDFKMDPYNEKMNEAFDTLVTEIYQLLRKSKYVNLFA